MGKAKQKRIESTEEFCSIAIRVEAYDAETEMAVNTDVYQPEFALFTSEQDPLYVETTIVTVQGSILAPSKRAGNCCSVTLYGNNAPSSGVLATLDDAHARDGQCGRMYRTYRGRTVPVYDAPKGLAVLEKVRGKSEWRSWILTGAH